YAMPPANIKASPSSPTFAPFEAIRHPYQLSWALLSRERLGAMPPSQKRRNMTHEHRAHQHMSLQVLRDVLSSEYRGPRAIFSEVHVLRAILAIGTSGSVGRGRLGSLVGLGQGEVRTLIKRMKENDLIV